MGKFHYDAPLTDLSVAYIQDQERFIARQVFPQVDSDFQSDLYYEWDRDDFLRDEAQERGPGTEAPVGDFGLKTNNFFCKEYAFAKDLPWQRQRNADRVLRLDQAAVRFVTQKLLIKQDALWAARYFTTGKWGRDVAGVDSAPGANEIVKWSEAGSTPIEDIDELKLSVEEQTGYVPNTLVLTPRVLKVLKHHADILDRVRYTQMGVITVDLLRAVFDVERILVARAVVTKSKKGAASANRGFLLNEGALLCYAADAPGIEVASAGYTFAWIDADSGAGEFGGGIRRFPIEEKKVDRVEGEFTLDFRIVGADLGVFLNDII